MEGARTNDAAIAHAHIAQVRELLASLDISRIESVVGMLRTARERGAAVYIIGNGGSAAAASHFATDLAKATRRSGRPPLRVTSLTDNTALMTALANDEGYERVFTGQLEGVLRDGDVLIVISASGSSPNVVRAAELARTRGATTVAMLGFDGGEMLRSADIVVHVRTEHGSYGPVEDTLLAVHHLITACLAQE